MQNFKSEKIGHLNLIQHADFESGKIGHLNLIQHAEIQEKN